MEERKVFKSSLSDDGHFISHELVVQALNTIAGVCRVEADRWWRNPLTGELLPDRNKGEMFALVHSEISEAFEAMRKDRMDDHLPNRSGVEVELADAIIRILDYCSNYNLDIGGAVVEKLLYNRVRTDHTNAARLAPGGKKF